MKLTTIMTKSVLSILALLLSACGPTPADDDTTPDNFVLVDKNDVELNQYIISDTVIIRGLSGPAQVSVSGGEYSAGNRGFTTEQGEIVDSQLLQLRVLSASDYKTSSSVTVTVGGVSATFTVTTKAEPQEPVVEPPVIEPPTSNSQVYINYNVRHVVGGVDHFDRQKFITIHAELTEHDWFDNDQFSRNAANEEPDLLTHFLQGYDVYLGRSTGGMTWNLHQIEQDPAKPGYVSESDATKRGDGAKWSYNNLPQRKAKVYQNEDRALDTIVGAQQHPFWPEGTLTKGGGWALSQADTEDEPLGTATGHYMAQYLAKFFDQNPQNQTREGQAKPIYVEVMNEPLYDLTTVRSGSDRVEPADVFRFHNTVANEIRKLNDDVLIGGYTTAFPDFDRDNFQRWYDRDKQFIDIAGENMDFFSIHLYDFPAFQNTEKYRRGSNMEATMDMLEHYSLLTFGETRPLVVSEYGAQVHTHINKGWSAERNTHSIRATNAMLMSFMERPDQILKTIPFIVLKAEWGRTEVPYGPRLMIQKFERDGAEAGDEWVYSDLVLFYQLWAEVKGTRIDTKASDLDIQVDAYVDDNITYLILNSLEFEQQDIDFHHFGLANKDIKKVTVNHLKTESNNQSVITTTTLNELPTSVTLGAEATMVIKLEFEQSLTIDQTMAETKYYADRYQQPINKDQAITLNIDDVVLGNHGEAILRLAFGRDHGLSLTPLVTVNGTEVNVPSDVRGYDQIDGVHNPGRDNFYGVVEIPVPYAALTDNNQITVTFDDAGGYVASAALQVFNATVALNRE